MFWLDPNTVSTLGDYLRAAGYDTFWKGKWHASHADIIVPDTHDAYLTYNNLTGIPISKNEHIYLNTNRLDNHGFNGWVGPEPHGTNPHNSGASAAIGLAGRDQIYASEVIKLSTGENNEKETWKYSRYFDNPQFWSNPGCENTNNSLKENHSSCQDKCNDNNIIPDEFEMYNLTKDPIESRNPANSQFVTTESSAIQTVLAKLLAQQCKTKRLYPTSGNVPGKPSCKDCTSNFGI